MLGWDVHRACTHSLSDDDDYVCESDSKRCDTRHALLLVRMQLVDVRLRVNKVMRSGVMFVDVTAQRSRADEKNFSKFVDT